MFLPSSLVIGLFTLILKLTNQNIGCLERKFSSYTFKTKTTHCCVSLLVIMLF